MKQENKTLNDYWPQIYDVIEKAKTDEELKKTLQFGTREEKLEALKAEGFSLYDLEFIHQELQSVMPPVELAGIRIWYY